MRAVSALLYAGVLSSAGPLRTFSIGSYARRVNLLLPGGLPTQAGRRGVPFRGREITLPLEWRLRARLDGWSRVR